MLIASFEEYEIELDKTVKEFVSLFCFVNIKGRIRIYKQIYFTCK